jgi:hypothetical protein
MAMSNLSNYKLLCRNDLDFVFALDPKIETKTSWMSGHTCPTGFYRLKRAKYLVFKIYDATLKIIAVAKVKANIVIHICSSIACLALPVRARGRLRVRRQWQRYQRANQNSPEPDCIAPSYRGMAER